MSEKIKGMFGSKTRADEVREWLKKQGAENHAFNGDLEDGIYYVYQGKAMTVDESLSFLFDIVELHRWRARVNKIYYYVTEGGYVFSKSEDAISSDNDRYKVGNYFRTKEEAEKYAEKFRELFKREKEK